MLCAPTHSVRLLRPCDSIRHYNIRDLFRFTYLLVSISRNSSLCFHFSVISYSFSLGYFLFLFRPFIAFFPFFLSYFPLFLFLSTLSPFPSSHCYSFFLCFPSFCHFISPLVFFLTQLLSVSRHSTNSVVNLGHFYIFSIFTQYFLSFLLC